MVAQTLNPREWVLAEAKGEASSTLAQDLSVHPLTAKILYHRGIRDADTADRFLNPTLRTMHDPFLMKDMGRAVRVVLRAIDAGQRIVVHGDYDVDGTCSVGVLYGFLQELGANVGYFVPRRDQDGYGLNIETVRRLRAEGTDLLITTDCGISNVTEIQFAKQLGMNVVIVDHHTVPDVLPPADAILNPLQKDCPFPFKELAAVGVTFNYVVAIRAELRKRGVFEIIPEPDLKNYLDLVALGTVADVMPLVDENRTFVRIGLEVLVGRRRAGVSALMDRAAIEVGPISARTISFRLAPRINAAGRMGDASMCVELLTTRSYGAATRLANELESLNRARQEEEKDILEAALRAADEQVAAGRQILVVAGVDWNRGVLGIVASRLMERYHRPAILLGIEDGFAKGSARSIAGISLIDVMNKASEFLTTYGGHTMAAGLSIEAQYIEQFQDKADTAIGGILGEGDLPKPTLKIDSEADFGQIDSAFIADLDRLAPFGSGNPEPILVARKSVASNIRVVAERHLRARFVDGSGSLDGFGFAMSEHTRLLNAPVAVAFVPRYINARGKRRFEIQIKGLKAADGPVCDRVEDVE